MNDNDIIKALENCKNNGDCKDCILNPHVGNYGYCTSIAIEAALDLIHRQKAEIERLDKELNTLTKQCYKSGIKDLAERLKEKSYIQKPYGVCGVVDVYVIDRIVKEMTEETP